MFDIVQDIDGTWRVKNVPLCSTGLDIPISTGVVTITEAMLLDAKSALSDPAVVEPRIKLGHASSYNNDLMGDAEPAFGRIDGDTMYIGDKGQTIYGDYAGMPEWLASVLPIAYPNRSIEASIDAETMTGKHYQMIITAVSLLGVTWPGIQVLEDFPTYYAAGAAIPSGVIVIPQENKIAAAAGQMGIKAAADIDSIKRAFWATVAVEDRYWWYPKAIRYDSIDGLSVIAMDDETGELFKLSVTVSGVDISFGDPVPVMEDYPELPANNLAASNALVAGMALANPLAMVVYASRVEAGGPEPTTTQKGVTGMDDTTRQALASQLGLSADATEDQITATISTLKAAAVTKPAVEDDKSDDKSDISNEDLLAAAAKSGLTLVDPATLEFLKAGAQTAVDLKAASAEGEITRIVTEAKMAGKIPPAAEASWKLRLSEDFASAKATIDAMQPGLIPVQLRGSVGDSDVSGGTDSGGAYPDSWFPEVAAIRAKTGSKQLVTNAKES